MCSISIETSNENLLTVEEYVRYIKINEKLQHALENNAREIMKEAEESVRGLTVDLVVKYSVRKS
jgi:hypothetical protein